MFPNFWETTHKGIVDTMFLSSGEVHTLETRLKTEALKISAPDWLLLLITSSLSE